MTRRAGSVPRALRLTPVFYCILPFIFSISPFRIAGSWSLFQQNSGQRSTTPSHSQRQTAFTLTFTPSLNQNPPASKSMTPWHHDTISDWMKYPKSKIYFVLSLKGFPQTSFGPLIFNACYANTNYQKAHHTAVQPFSSRCERSTLSKRLPILTLDRNTQSPEKGHSDTTA